MHARPLAAVHARPPARYRRATRRVALARVRPYGPYPDWPAGRRCAQEIMQDPVFTADGQTYERQAIIEWLEGHDTSPLTGRILDHKVVVPNYAMRGMISALLVKPRSAAHEDDAHRTGSLVAKRLPPPGQLPPSGQSSPTAQPGGVPQLHISADAPSPDAFPSCQRSGRRSSACASAAVVDRPPSTRRRLSREAPSDVATGQATSRDQPECFSDAAIVLEAATRASQHGLRASRQVLERAPDGFRRPAAGAPLSGAQVGARHSKRRHALAYV